MKPRYQKIFDKIRKDGELKHLSDEDLITALKVYEKCNKKYGL